MVTAIALDVFLVPNKIAAGGVSGIATIVYYLFGAPVGVTMLLINIPLFLASVKTFGAHFGLKTLIGTIILSVSVDLFAGKITTINDPFLVVLYGGVLTGFGMGITFRGGGTTGGTDLAARIIHHFVPITLGQALLSIDVIVIILAGITFNPQLALYAMIVLFITGKVIDTVQEGFSYAKGAIVISDKPTEIAASVLAEMNRGVTVLNGFGGYTHESKEILFIVVGRAEITAIKQLVTKIDAKAFVVITDVREVLGEGFKES
jgi:uncharacterized membrane-anchored protein YitT (DUF2179 family)